MLPETEMVQRAQGNKKKATFYEFKTSSKYHNMKYFESCGSCISVSFILFLVTFHHCHPLRTIMEI